MLKALFNRLRARLQGAQAPAIRPRLEVILGDITRQEVDVIVNAAKPTLLGGGGVDGAIHLAGGPEILAECRAIAATLPGRELPTGHAVVTGAGRLPCLMVAHTVGPVFPSVASRQDDLLEYRRRQLRDCYFNSLAVADDHGAQSIAFPLISSGVYGWPVKDAIRQALFAIQASGTRVKTVRLVLFDLATYRLAVDMQAERD
jgi:O-acetyl-ADP-ribose deacetylase (regulator of RNase III)